MNNGYVNTICRMKIIIKIVLISFCNLTILFSVISQVNYLSKEIVFALNSEDRKEIMNAEKIKAYGDELMREAELMEKGIGLKMVKKEDYLSDKIRQMDDETLDISRRAVRKKIRASKHYGNANLITAYVYTKNLKELSFQSSGSDKKKIESFEMIFSYSNNFLSILSYGPKREGEINE